MKKKVEQETEQFVIYVSALRPEEFIGVASLLRVPLSEDMSEILMTMIDAFAALKWNKRKKVLRVLEAAGGGLRVSENLDLS